MSVDVIVLADHIPACDEMIQRNGWNDPEDRWLQERRPPLTEPRDSLGRRHRHGKLFIFWRCAGLLECPGRALVRQDTQRALISTLIASASGTGSSDE